MKGFYFLLLFQHTDEMFSVFFSNWFSLQLFHTRKYFIFFLFFEHTYKSAFNHFYCELFDYIPYTDCPQ